MKKVKCCLVGILVLGISLHAANASELFNRPDAGSSTVWDIPIAEVISHDDSVFVPLLDAPDGVPLGDLFAGMRVAMLGEANGDWRYIGFDDTFGYLSEGNLAVTGEFASSIYSLSPVSGYGVYLYDGSAYGENPFIDIDGFLNATRFPSSGPDDLDNRVGSLVSTSPVSIYALFPDCAQIEFHPCKGFGPREYLHTYMFDDVYHSSVSEYPEGQYCVGSEIETGLYSFRVEEGKHGSLEIASEGMSSPVIYDIKGPAIYTVYLPENAIAKTKAGVLLSMTPDSIFVPDDTSISGSMRLLVGQQVKLSHEDFYSIVLMEGCQEGYYRISTFLVDSGMLPQGEMKKLQQGEITNLYLRQGEFIEFINCTLEKDVSNG